jgi:hypothetical protein
MRRQAILALSFAAGAALGGPVEVYREGPRYCPRDRTAASPVIDAAQAIARARALVPDGFCGPTRWVAGCDTLVEFEHGTWRVYVHQYRRQAERRDWLGLTHTYVILDAVGNCIHNIPGTELGSAN